MKFLLLSLLLLVPCALAEDLVKKAAGLIQSSELHSRVVSSNLRKNPGTYSVAVSEKTNGEKIKMDIKVKKVTGGKLGSITIALKGNNFFSSSAEASWDFSPLREKVLDRTAPPRSGSIEFSANKGGVNTTVRMDRKGDEINLTIKRLNMGNGETLPGSKGLWASEDVYKVAMTGCGVYVITFDPNNSRDATIKLEGHASSEFMPAQRLSIALITAYIAKFIKESEASE